MGATDISIVVRSCGRPALLARALASIREQTLQPDEIVVVAIGSDGLAAIEKAAGSMVLRIVPVSAGRARGAALNDGIRLARGPWYAVLDDDDTWAPTFLQEMMGTVSPDEADPALGGVACQTELIYERYRNGTVVNCGRKPFNPQFHRIDPELMAETNPFTINAVLWHRRVFSEVGEYREDLNLLEDWEFNMRAALRFQLRVLPRPLARYHRRPPGDQMPNIRLSESDRAARVLQARWREAGVGGRPVEATPLTFGDAIQGFRRFIFRMGSWLRWRFR